MRKNYDLFKNNHLAPNLKYEFIELNTDTINENNSNINQNNSNKLNKNNINNKKNVNQNKTQNKEEFKIVKSLDNNFILNVITMKRNDLWRREFFEKINQANGYASIDSNSLTIVKSNLNTNISQREWSKEINDAITFFIRGFSLELIDYKNIVNRKNIVKDLKDKIEEMRRVYLIDFVDYKGASRLNIIARKAHINDFFERNYNFKLLTRSFNRSFHQNQQVERSKVLNDDPGIEDLFNLDNLIPVAAKGKLFLCYLIIKLMYNLNKV